MAMHMAAVVPRAAQSADGQRLRAPLRARELRLHPVRGKAGRFHPKNGVQQVRGRHLLAWRPCAQLHNVHQVCGSKRVPDGEVRGHKGYRLQDVHGVPERHLGQL